MNNNTSIFHQVLSQVNIVDIISNYLSVSQKGKNFWSACPFHNDSNPSMSISEEKQIYKCFSCGAAGNAINFVKNINNLSNIEALKKVADIAGIDLDIKFSNQEFKEQKTQHQTKLIEINNKANDFFMLCLKGSAGKPAYDYLTKRGLTDEIIEQFKIGYAPSDNAFLKLIQKWDYLEIEIADSGLFSLKNDKFADFFTDRITFAISDEESNTVGFSGRIYKKDDQRAKYSNSPETKIFTKSKILYNIDNAKKTLVQTNEIIVCEGFLDVIALYHAGFKNAVATMGTAFSKTHIQILKKYTNTLNIFMDSDQAGQKAALNIAVLAIKHGFEIKIVSAVADMDVYDIYVNLGKDKLGSMVQESKKIFQYLIDEAMPKINKSNVEQIAKFKQFIAPIVQNYKNKDEVAVFNNIIAKEFGIALTDAKVTQDIEKPNFNNPKETKAKKDLTKKPCSIEQKTLLLMIKDKKASELYKTKLNFLPNKIQKTLASYIVKYWETNSEFTTDSFEKTISKNSTVCQEFKDLIKLQNKIYINDEWDLVSEMDALIQKIKPDIDSPQAQWKAQVTKAKKLKY